uniref:Ras-related protein Rab n=1 Tax=Trichogramma kaykai TaxID=54128 RepID=A0ABD2WDK2_9HYME
MDENIPKSKVSNIKRWKNKKIFPRKLKIDKIRSKVTKNENRGSEGGNNSDAHQSYIVDAESKHRNSKTNESVNQPIEDNQSRSTVTVLQRKFSYSTISSTSKIGPIECDIENIPTHADEQENVTLQSAHCNENYDVVLQDVENETIYNSQIYSDTNPTYQDSDNQFIDIKNSIHRRDIDEKMEKKKENSEISSEATSKKYMDMTTNEIGAVGDKKEYLFKILVIGELGTGKTSIIKRYVHQFFSQHYRATIGVDFALKVLNWDSQTIIRLQLWDIAGQERFGSMTRVYYKEAVGAFIVFDVTRSATLDAVIKWKQDLDSKLQLVDGSPIPCVLLANKCDQQKEGLVNSITKMNEYCEDKGFAGWFETSAKNNINIEEAANFLVNQVSWNFTLGIIEIRKDLTVTLYNHE